jgi:hypothetical protein
MHSGTTIRPASPSKKVYRKPRLCVYGDIHKITLTTMSSTTGDNARAKQNNKTGG